MEQTRPLEEDTREGAHVMQEQFPQFNFEDKVQQREGEIGRDPKVLKLKSVLCSGRKISW